MLNIEQLYALVSLSYTEVPFSIREKAISGMAACSGRGRLEVVDAIA